MRMRVIAALVALALAVAGAGAVFDWWQQRPISGVVSGPDVPEYGIGAVTKDLDEQAAREAKTVEDFKKVTGLRTDTAAPSPSAWRP